jgi:AraC-like DNA-binding protein
VVIDIARELNTEYGEKCGECFLELPAGVGDGNIRGINFDGGLGIIQYDCKFQDDIEIQYIVNKVHPLKFLYCLEGKLDHRFENEDVYNTIRQFQSAIVASEQYRGHILQFDAGVHSVINSLEIDRREFLPKISCEIRSLQTIHKDLFEDIDAKSVFYHEGFYSLEMADLFQELKAFTNDGLVRRLNMEAKAYQMLTKQVRQYQDDLEEVENRSILRQSEVESIREAAAIIRDEISQLDTIDSLAFRVGLNIRKLQEGFQHMFNQTVNTYVQGIRLDLAKDLLLNFDYSISEIVYLIGLSSKSYFSKIFREHYGTTPSEFRQSHLDSLKRMGKPSGKQ